MKIASLPTTQKIATIIFCEQGPFHNNSQRNSRRESIALKIFGAHARTKHFSLKRQVP